MKSEGHEVVVVDGKAVVAKKIDRAAAIEKAEMFVAKNLTKYAKKLHELAMGITVARETKGKRGRPKGPTVYQVPPNLEALKYLTDRGLGKTPQRHEITGQEGGPMEIVPWAPVGMVVDGEAEEVDG